MTRDDALANILSVAEEYENGGSASNAKAWREIHATLSEGTTHHLNSNRSVAVGDYFWQPMNTCPRGVKVQLLTVGRVAVYGVYRDGDDGYIGWAPVPKIPEGM